MRLFALLLVAATTVASYDSTPVIVGYYADWTSARLPANKIPYSKLTHINYAFAVSADNGAFTVPTETLLKQVVALAHQHKTKVLLSVGGWTGSRYFSPLMATKASRAFMIAQLLSLIPKYKLDGIDIDWEFPGRQGMSCNAVDKAHDTDNYLLFLQEYKSAKAKLKSKTELTMAVRIAPFDKNGSPLANVAKFAALTDRINIMAYDLNGGGSSVTGPNAPLQDKKDPASSAVGAVKAWYKAKWPLGKMTLGVPFYGRAVTTKNGLSAATIQKIKAGQSVKVNMLGVPIVSTAPQGDSDDAKWAEPCPGAPAVFSGVWKWANIRSQGILTNKKTWIGGWDATSQTPWLYNVDNRSFVSYDDTKSIKIKAKYAACTAGLAGVMIWDLSQDYKNELLNAIHAGAQC